MSESKTSHFIQTPIVKMEVHPLRLWGVGFCWLAVLFLQVNGNFVMTTYELKKSGTLDTARDKHQEIRCGMRCNLDDGCQGYMVSSDEQDPCSLIFEHSVEVEVGSNEVFYKLKEARSGKWTKILSQTLLQQYTLRDF